MKRLSKLLIISILAISLAGCGKIPKLKDGSEAVAKTKKGEISANTLYEELKKQYGNTTLIDLFDKLILDDMYEETDEEKDYINDQLSSVEEYAKQSNYTLEQYLKMSGFDSLNAAKDYLRLNYRREQAVNSYIEDNLTDKEIEKYYEEEIKGDINCKHILISPDTTTDMSDEEKEKAKEKALATAKEVIKKLDDGEDFDKLVKEYSSDEGSKEDNGDLGWFNTGDMVEPFEEAAYKLEKGKYTKTPVETTYGYHIIYKIDEKDKPKLKDKKDEIKTALRENKLSEDSTLYYKALEEIRKNAGLEIYDSELKDDYKTYMNNLTTPAVKND